MIDTAWDARRRLGAVVAAACIAGALLALVGGKALAWARGYAIYHGHYSVVGRISGHGFDLPPQALRCAGCHESGDTAATELSINLSDLTQPKSRRGGPATQYTVESFCALLRTGLDPASIVVERAMPRFGVSDADCAALWTYLGYS